MRLVTMQVLVREDAFHRWSIRIQPMDGNFGTVIESNEMFSRQEDARQQAEGTFGPLDWGVAGQHPNEARFRALRAPDEPAADPDACPSCHGTLAHFAGPGRRRGRICYMPGCDLENVELTEDDDDGLTPAERGTRAAEQLDTLAARLENYGFESIAGVFRNYLADEFKRIDVLDLVEAMRESLAP